VSLLVCSGAGTSCSFGAAPGTLMAMPGTVTEPAMPAATVTDMMAYVNIAPFGMCMSLANPAVAAATAAALGALTPQPCTPVPVSPWVPGALKVMICGRPALTSDSMTTCAFGGVIKITTPQQFITQGT